MDWSLRGCARHGHVTFRPDEPDLAARLHAPTPAGEAWRCLRCGTFVLGEPQGGGPAADAPLVLRGRQLREATILRLFAVERWVRATVLALLGYAVLQFRTSESSLEQTFDRILPAARPLAQAFDLDIDHSPIIARIHRLLETDPRTLAWIGAGLFAYACLQVAEGVGLWSLKRWGEYLAAVATSVFLPFEIYELIDKVTPLRLAAFLLNIALVAYLVLTKRLFGVRGGGTAYAAQRHEASLLTVEAAAAAQASPAVEQPTRQPATPL
ncbi:MAG TPA: DUF2127 domain-containing protein [Actinomycetes bacterium]|nr:DUF2127 domain-containing protein [Actinomycetes bacterium]